MLDVFWKLGEIVSVTVCGILGASYCGSTLMGWVINSHPQVTAIGEVHHIVKEIQRPDNLWATRDDGCFFHVGGCPMFRDNEKPYRASEIHRLMAERAGVSIICDESKNWNSFQKYEQVKSADEYRYIVLVKNPLEQVQSFVKHEQPRGKNAEKYFDVVLRIYRATLGFVQSRRRVICSYRAFCTNTDNVLRRVATLLGIDASGFNPDRYWESEIHPISGNTRVYVEQSPIHYSESWREQDPIVSDATLEKLHRMYNTVLEMGDNL